MVRRARQQAGLTQQSLGDRAGTSQAAVARYESDSTSPSVATLERLLRAAGSTLVLSTAPARPVDLSSTRAALLRRHRGDVLRLARKAGASNVRVFGSVARGDDDAGSDIDLLVDFDVAGGLLPIIALQGELEELLGQKVDVAPVSMLKDSVAETALPEAIAL